MTRAVNIIKKDGTKISGEILQHYSPYRVGHINRLGIFQLDTNKKPINLEYELLKND